MVEFMEDRKACGIVEMRAILESLSTLTPYIIAQITPASLLKRYFRLCYGEPQTPYGHSLKRYGKAVSTTVSEKHPVVDYKVEEIIYRKGGST